ncbi:HIT-like domain-containing protein [Pilobolus umbonatus]|nr:HIT-like domain-containing protein [Pilobolus umbonatus]
MLCFGNRKCVFCHIESDSQARIVATTQNLIAFHDRAPASHLHLLIIPRKHIKNIKTLEEEDRYLLNEMTALGQALMKDQGIQDTSLIRMGFHVPPFTSINHLHLHVIALPFKNKWSELVFTAGHRWFMEIFPLSTSPN